MAINPPGPVSFYFHALVGIFTFEIFSIKSFFEAIPILEFNYVTLATLKTTFRRIGIEDRNFIYVLGCVIIYISLFLILQFIYYSLLASSCFFTKAKKWMMYFYCETPYRTILLLFLLETYIDLLLGGLVNTENLYLTLDPNNWGPNGYMTKGDQVAIVVGYIFYIFCMVFPYFVWYIL